MPKMGGESTPAVASQIPIPKITEPLRPQTVVSPKVEEKKPESSKPSTDPYREPLN
jgi:hypothetical protein